VSNKIVLQWLNFCTLCSHTWCCCWRWWCIYKSQFTRHTTPQNSRKKKKKKKGAPREVHGFTFTSPNKLTHLFTKSSPSISFLLLPFSPLCIYFLLDFSTHAPSNPLYLTLSFSFTLHLSHIIHTLILHFFFFFFFLFTIHQHGWHQPRRDKKRERRSGTSSSFLCVPFSSFCDFYVPFCFICQISVYPFVFFFIHVPFSFSPLPWPFSS